MHASSHQCGLCYLYGTACAVRSVVWGPWLRSNSYSSLAGAAMDIMMRLTGSDFSAIANEFRERERRLGGGLPLLDFVEIVLQGLPRARSAEDKAANISALVDLFEDIDINGDGVMGFDEFTSFCVDAGMVATRAKAAALKHRYVRDTKHVIKTANGSMGIEKIKWSPECRKFMVIEHAAKAVKLFAADGAFIAEVGMPVASDNNASSLSASGVESGGAATPSSEFDRSSKGDELQGSPTGRKAPAGSSSSANAANSTAATSIFVLDAVFVPKFHWLVTSTTDFSISFFDMDESRNSAIGRVLPGAAAVKPSASFELLKPLTITTATAQLLLRFCAHSNLLVGSGNDFVVNIWEIIDGETKVLWKRLLTHQDMVMDFLEVPQHDLRRCIQLWESQNCRSRGSLVGHSRGVRQIVYSSHHDLLLSAGFEFEAYAWDLGSRQIVMKLAGHRAPLVGVQLALFQTERAITADAQGVFKVWDISRNSGVYGSATSSSRQGSGLVGSTTHAVQLESIEPALQFARFEPMTFVSLHPLSRDVWTSTAGSSTLHRFQSKRIQQFDEIPLSGFYHYNANKFVVVNGSVCSVWDGESGTCTEEFVHVGNVGAADFDRDNPTGGGDSGGTGGGGAGEAGKGNNHNGAENGQAQGPTSEVLVCAHDAKCRKLVVVSELGFMGVFNCLNFVQMRQCLERFNGAEASSASSTSLALSRSASSRIVGLHYCSDNKLVVATDASTSAIVVIDDNVSHDSANGTKRTPVLRRIVNIPGGIAASAYSYHASVVATVAESDGMLISLWDFETLTLIAQCQFDDNDAGGDAGDGAPAANRMQLLQFWDEFPVLFAADSHGRVFAFAVMPLIHAYAGKLLHVFVNSYSSRSSDAQVDGNSVDESSSPNIPSGVVDSSLAASTGELAVSPSGNGVSTTFITEAAESAAQKMLLRSRQKKLGSISAVSSHKGEASAGTATVESLAAAPPSSSVDPSPVILTTTVSSAVTSMKIAFDDSDDRYVLFTGDENGHVAVWDLSAMTKKLALTKIPEIKRKCMRRGYHPKATFSLDCAKEGKPMLHPRERRHHQPVFQGDWRRSMLLGEDIANIDVRAAQMDLKRLSKRRIEARKRPTTAAVGSASASKQQQQLLPPPTSSGPAPQAKDQADAAVDSAVAAAEAFLGGGQRKSIRNIASASGGTAKRKPTSTALLSSSQSLAATGALAPEPQTLGSLKGPSSSVRPTGSNHMLVAVVCRWQAHHDAVTSIEVTRNPNVIVTCSLDTRVFVWDWRGECLGKLFDAENVGSCRWRFRKNDAKREHERDQVVRDIMRELDLTPREKLQRRRQTLYEEHVGRRSQAELQHVNAMLLDHIISKNPELEVMEKAAYSTREDAGTDTNGGSTSGGAYPGDAEVNAALERSRQRNHRAKLSMITKLQGAVALTSKQKPGGRSANTLEVVALKQTALRMKSLSQVGPPLCVDRFDYRNQPANGNNNSGKSNSRASTGASVTTFADHGDIRMDKAYLEEELAVSPDSTGHISNGSTVAAVQDQIQAEHLAAEAVVEHRATLERKARELYSNFEAIKRRLGKEKRALPPSSQSASTSALLGADPTLPLSAANLLEPSEFLKKHLPASALALRPQTAPLHRASSSTPKCDKPSPVQLSSSNSSASLSAAASKKTQHQLPRAGSASTRHPLHGSESEPALAAAGAHKPPLLPGLSTKSGGSNMLAYNRRKNSLDELFLDEVNRQSLSPVLLPPPHIHEDSAQVPSNGEAALEATDIDGVGASSHHQHSSAKSSLQKLVGINEIISRVHNYSSALSKDPDPPVSDAHGRLEGDATDPAAHAVDEETVRQHLEVSKDRMMAAMHDGEWSSSHRHVVKKQRQAAQQQKKARRMEDYLQQKRREMNTSIGNVFKHTSFAFQSSASDDAHSHPSGDRSGRRRVVSSSSSSSPIKPGAASGDRRSSKGAKAKDKKQSVFGIYSAREVMSVIRLFWVMDEDASGNISLDELLQYKHFFEKLGHSDMTTVFQAIDKDGNGQVSLRELLEICFHYATKYQLEEMLKLAKLGSVRSYLQGGWLSSDGGESGSANGAAPAGQGAGARSLPAEHRRELMQIFKLFDSNGDGGVSMQEIMEALCVDDDDVMAAVMTKGSSTDGGSGGLLTSGITRDDVEQFYREFDRDSDAVLDFDEFVALMRSLYGPRVSPHQ